MTNPKSKSKMVKALRKWHNRGDATWYRQYLESKSKSEITRLFNEAIAKRGK